MSDPKLPKILCVDDEKNMLASLRRQMRKQFNISTAINAQEGLKILKEQGPFDVIISDFRMPEMDGAEFLKKAKEIDPSTTRILLTGEAGMKGLQSAVNESQVYRVLFKPCSAEDLQDAVNGGVEQHKDKKSTNEQIDELLKSLVP